MVSISKNGWPMLPPKFSCGYPRKLPPKVERVFLTIDGYLDFSFDGIDEFPTDLIPPIKLGETPPPKFKSTIYCLLFQLIQAAVSAKSLKVEIALALPFNKNKYFGKGALDRFGAGFKNMTLGYEAALLIRDYWLESGYITFNPGKKPKGRASGYESSIVPSTKLVPILYRLFEAIQSNPQIFERRSRKPKGWSRQECVPLVIKCSGDKKVLYPNIANPEAVQSLGPIHIIRSQEEIVRLLNRASSQFTYGVQTHTDLTSYNTNSKGTKKAAEEEGGGREQGEKGEEGPTAAGHAPYYAYPSIFQLPSHWFVYQRIRHDDYLSGGRFYAPFQSLIRSEQRKDLLINGMPTVELDFSNFHAMMLYHKEMIDPLTILRNKGFSVKPGGWVDLYEIPGSLAPRDIKKVALTIAIYSRSYSEAIEALKVAIESQIFKLKGSPRFKYDDGRWYLINEPHKEPTPEELLAAARLSHLDPKTVMAHVIDAHSAIQHHFFKGTDTWKYLQAIDSEIAELVMSHFLLKGRPCCGIHDSFVVWQEDESELLAIMVKAYQHVVGTPFKPSIKTINHQSSAEVVSF